MVLSPFFFNRCCFSIALPPPPPLLTLTLKLYLSSQVSIAVLLTARVTSCSKSTRGSTRPPWSFTTCAATTVISWWQTLEAVLIRSTMLIATGIPRSRRLVECRSSPTIWSDSCRSHGIASASSIATSFSLQASIVLQVPRQMTH